jgi:hypothetical protein
METDQNAQDEDPGTSLKKKRNPQSRDQIAEMLNSTG